MTFIDEVHVEVQAGRGGKGMVTFRKEKFVPRGGPDGGDGGKGGSVIVKVDTNLTTLLDFRYHHVYKAEPGNDGASKKMYGKDGASKTLRVPPGTLITDEETGEVLADMTHADQVAVIARGGVGGKGNAHFATSIHQAPKFAELGEPGEQHKVKMELKLLADVGLLGFPNVGKSTLVAAVSAARPKIANYPFTTLVPNLGVVYVDANRNFVMADIPGIIEGASEGHGLGHQFLRHVSRSRLLIHILDVSGLSGRDPLSDFEILNQELVLYDDKLASLPQIVALNKVDVLGEHEQEAVNALEAILTSRGLTVYRISAATRTGLSPLIYDCMTRLEAMPRDYSPLDDTPDHVHIIASRADDKEQFAIEIDEESGVFVVTGKGLERTVSMTDITNEFSLRRLQKTMERMGVNTRLKALGVKHGDSVKIGEMEFDYEDEDRYDEEEEEAIGGRKKK